LTLADTPVGLGLEAVLLREDPDAAAAASKVRRGVLSNLSIGFQVPENGERWDGDLRTVQDVRLVEVSLVAKGANPGAGVEMVRAADGVELECRSVPIVVARQDGGGPYGPPVANTIESEDDEGETCPTCGGSGKIMDGNRQCPTCNGTGKVQDDDDEDADMDDGRKAEIIAEARRDFTDKEKEQHGKQGAAVWIDGHWAFPTPTRADFDNAVRALGRTPGRNRATVRRYLIARAKKMGWPIPSSWQSDGSIKRSQLDLDAVELELRAMRHRLPSLRSSDAELELERMGRELAERKQLERAFLAPSGTWRV
jgi:uncharacterized Zn finger protein (UPF0148 family)